LDFELKRKMESNRTRILENGDSRNLRNVGQVLGRLQEDEGRRGQAWIRKDEGRLRRDEDRRGQAWIHRRNRSDSWTGGGPGRGNCLTPTSYSNSCYKHPYSREKVYNFRLEL